MSHANEKLFEQRARIMKALAHPSRLMMVDELSRGDRYVGELRELVGADISTVSKHLSVLKGAGIVDCDKRGLEVFYRLRVPYILNLFSIVDAVRRGNERHAAASITKH